MAAKKSLANRNPQTAEEFVNSFTGRKRIRRSFGKIREVAEMPNLNDVQKQSYEQFLQAFIAADDRTMSGLQEVLSSVFPIKDFAEKSAILPDLDKAIKPHGSDYAELYAVARALRDIPSGSKVMLRMDCQNVLDWLDSGKMTRGSKTETILAPVFAQALRIVSEMEFVDFIKASDKNNENMALAHQLSRKGALLTP